MADNNLVVGGVVPVASFGLTGTGDDTDAIQACFDMAPTGSTLVFPAGPFRVSRGLRVTRRFRIVGSPGTRIVQGYDSTRVGEACLTVTAPGSTVTGLTITGNDTPSTYDTLYSTLSAANLPRYAAVAVTGEGITVREVTVTSRICGVAVTSGTRCLVDNARVTGIGATPPTSPLNYHPAVMVSAGAHNQVTASWATGTGQTVLGGGSTNTLKVIGCYGANLGDNGIYISSGANCQVVAYTVDTVVGSGVKVRGSGHTVTGCNIANAYIGVNATGTTAPVIEGRWGGEGLIIAANQIRDTRRLGIYVEDHSTSGYYLRAVNVHGNILVRTAVDGGADAAIHIVGDEVHESGNVIVDHRGTRQGVVIQPAP